jgi:hypothetical protein
LVFAISLCCSSVLVTSTYCVNVIKLNTRHYDRKFSLFFFFLCNQFYAILLITKIVLRYQVRFITQSDYQDVVEERVILKLCGYAICKNKLENIPLKKYHISTRSNRVYDITERKVLYDSLLCNFDICRTYCK